MGLLTSKWALHPVDRIMWQSPLGLGELPKQASLRFSHPLRQACSGNYAAVGNCNESLIFFIFAGITDDGTDMRWCVEMGLNHNFTQNMQAQEHSRINEI